MEEKRLWLPHQSPHEGACIPPHAPSAAFEGREFGGKSAASLACAFD